MALASFIDIIYAFNCSAFYRTDMPLYVHSRGQAHPVGSFTPYFGPSLKLDFELEMVYLQATNVGPGNELGKPVDINYAQDHIFGLVLLNDWSGSFQFNLSLSLLLRYGAQQLEIFRHRDIFLLVHLLIKTWAFGLAIYPTWMIARTISSRSLYSTTISPWIVTMEALEPFARETPKQGLWTLEGADPKFYSAVAVEEFPYFINKIPGFYQIIAYGTDNKNLQQNY
ncbi:Fumarylacetoacetase [Glycine max]|nr:Fumarylacetoacetase [Glycine max]